MVDRRRPNFLCVEVQLRDEHSSTRALVQRHVRGGLLDDTLVIYDGTNAAMKTWLQELR